MTFGGKKLLLIALSLCPASHVSGAYSQDRTGRTYETGQTEVSRLGLRTVARTIPPVNLRAQAAAQRQLSISIQATLRILGQPPAGGPYGDARDECSVSLRKFDWRDHGGATGVRDQGNCGDCFIFGAMGAFEGNWRIVNKQEIDVSEQQALDCAKAGSCDGGWHSGIFNYLRDKGVTSEAAIPYTASSSGRCRMVTEPNYSAVNWEYVDAGGGKGPVSAIKRALCEHGPITSSVLATDDFLKYTSGIFNQHIGNLGESDINHDVVIVGWDDDQDVWIIKNSWRSSWGEKGFMRIRYDSNNIGFGAAWIDAAKIGMPLASVRAATQKAISHLTADERRSLFDLRLLPR